MDGTPKILIAQIGAAHGVRGEVRVKSFAADPQALAGYRDLLDDKGRTFTVERMRPAREMLVVKFKGVADRNAAETLNGTKLFVPRTKLPEPDEDEFYHADLIGLQVVTEDGESLGAVVAVHDFGAGDILEIAPPRGVSMLLPFTRATVPHIDLAGGTIVVSPPPDAEHDDAADEQMR